jgi:hypothetical protein
MSANHNGVVTIFDINGTLYKVINERGGNRPRRLELVEDVGTSA